MNMTEERGKVRRKIESVVSLDGQTQEFVIKEAEDHITLSGYLTSDVRNVFIPEKIHDKPVTEISGDGFFCHNEIETIIFPKSLKKIGHSAFAMCKGLKKLILPDSVIEIEPFAFRDCTGLQIVRLPDNLNRIQHGTFSFCNLDQPEFKLPKNLEVIESGAFSSAGMFDLVIPDSVEVIEDGAFAMFGPKAITSLPENENWYLSKEERNK